MSETIIEKIDLTKIRPSATNPRKHFDEDYITQLSDSIRAKGILQPLTLRPDWCMGKTDEDIAGVNGNAPTPHFYEIVAGECRYRGAVKAEELQAPSIVRLLSDKETLEIQLIENLQRSDLTPLEEAEGYRRLVEDYGYTVEMIHEKTGKTTRTIYGKLKLLNAPKILLDAMVKGIVGEGHCELVGRIPSPEMRERAAEDILHPKFLQEEIGGGLRAMPEQPMSLRVARTYVRETHMRSLSGAQFDQKDATLLAVIQDAETGERVGGGACVDCPMRSGNRPELLGDLKRPDICANPKCFALKTDAHFARLQSNAEGEGKRILTDEEARKEFDESGALSLFSRYVKLTDQPAADHCRDGVKRPSWKKLLEGLESKPEILVWRDPKGRVVELVDFQLAREAVNLAAKQKGEKSIFDKSVRTSTKTGGAGLGPISAATGKNGGAGSAEEEPEWKKQERKNREIARVNFQITLAGMTALSAAIIKGGEVSGFWDAMINLSMTHAGHEGRWLIGKRLGLEKSEDTVKQMLEYGRGLGTDQQKMAFVVELLLSQEVKIYNSGSMGGIRSVDRFKAMAKLYKVDLAEVEKVVKASEKKPKAVTAARVAGKSNLKSATPAAVIVDPTQEQLEKAFSAPEINNGTIRHPVQIDGKLYTVSSIVFPAKGPPIFDLVELIPAAEFKGKTRTSAQASEKKGPTGHYYGVAVKHHGESFVLGFSHEHKIKAAGKGNGTKPKAKKEVVTRPKRTKARRVVKKKGGAKR